MNIKNSLFEINQIDNVDERLSILRKSLSYHAKRYYVMDEPEISDYEYDMMYAELLRLEAENPELFDPESPSQRVGGAALDKFGKVTHTATMNSLSDVFSFEELKDGLNTQLLIYLFSICKAQSEETKAELGCAPNGNVIPAGIQYVSSNVPSVSIEKFCETEEIEKTIQNKFSRSGLISNNPDIINALNHNHDSKFITSVKQEADGSFSGKSLVSDERFEEIYGMLSETIIQIAESMKGGKANAIPFKTGAKAPCRYCKMSSICRASAHKSI